MGEDGFSSALLTGGIGAIAGGIGGFFEAKERRRAFERFRQRQQEGITRARDETETRVTNLLDNPLISAASDFIQSSFEGGGNDPLTQQFTRSLRVAQEERGLRRSVAGAGAEAGAVAAFRQQFLANLLPQAQSFGTLGERFRQQILQQELPIGIAFETGAPIPGVSQFTPDISDPAGFSPFLSAFQGGAQGFAGGFQVGQSFNQVSNQNSLIDRLLEGQRQQQAPIPSGGVQADLARTSAFGSNDLNFSDVGRFSDLFRVR